MIAGPGQVGDELGPAPCGGELVTLDADHPGFRDPVYRARRAAIARLALGYQGGPVPAVPYTSVEHDVWRTVNARLGPLHAAHVSLLLREAAARLRLDADRIPQMADVNEALQGASGFRMVPVAGLVQPATFLRRLGRGEFLATQYVRHHSAPLYTPEPDVIHELVGHAASLTLPCLAQLSQAFGQAAARTTCPATLQALERGYWFTLEFGLVEERGGPRALGAGLLSSAGELEHALKTARLLPWDLARSIETGYDPTQYQPVLFLAPSIARLVDDSLSWLARSHIALA